MKKKKKLFKNKFLVRIMCDCLVLGDLWMVLEMAGWF